MNGILTCTASIGQVGPSAERCGSDLTALERFLGEIPSCSDSNCTIANESDRGMGRGEKQGTRKGPGGGETRGDEERGEEAARGKQKTGGAGATESWR